MKLQIENLLIPAQAALGLLTSALGVKKDELIVSCEAGKRMRVQIFPNNGSPFGLRFDIGLEEAPEKPIQFSVDHDVFFHAIGGRKGHISLSVANSELHFTSGRLKGRMPCIPFKSQTLTADKSVNLIDSTLFDLIAKAVGSCTIQAASPVIFVSCKAGELRVMMSSDYQMAVARYQVEKKRRLNFALPPTHFSAIKQLADSLGASELTLQSDDQRVSIQIGKHCTIILPTVAIDTDKYEKMSNLLDMLAKNKPEKGSVIQASKLLSALKSAGAVSDVGTYATLIGKKGGIEVEVSSGHGHIRDLVAIESDSGGKPLTGQHKVDPTMMQQSLSRFNSPVLKIHSRPPVFTIYEASKDEESSSSVLHVGRLVDEV
jgi:hypothetical protein